MDESQEFVTRTPVKSCKMRSSHDPLLGGRRHHSHYPISVTTNPSDVNFFDPEQRKFSTAGLRSPDSRRGCLLRCARRHIPSRQCEMAFKVSVSTHSQIEELSPLRLTPADLLIV